MYQLAKAALPTWGACFLSWMIQACFPTLNDLLRPPLPDRPDSRCPQSTINLLYKGPTRMRPPKNNVICS